jgi:hypothetical protein
VSTEQGSRGRQFGDYRFSPSVQEAEWKYLGAPLKPKNSKVIEINITTVTVTELVLTLLQSLVPLARAA